MADTGCTAVGVHALTVTLKDIDHYLNLFVGQKRPKCSIKEYVGVPHRGKFGSACDIRVVHRRTTGVDDDDLMAVVEKHPGEEVTDMPGSADYSNPHKVLFPA